MQRKKAGMSAEIKGESPFWQAAQKSGIPATGVVYFCQF